MSEQTPEYSAADTNAKQLQAALSSFGVEKQQETGQAVVARSSTEVQGAVAMARQFPRDQRTAIARIIESCSRPTLAEVAMYSYPKGGQLIEGPSIRLAEAVAQNWGNIRTGIEEISTNGKQSEVRVYAWDLETNAYDEKVFAVEHARYTRQGRQQLTDSRDKYENLANLAARRKRACILAVIPGDVIDLAMNQVHVTMANSIGKPEEVVPQMLEAFRQLDGRIDEIVVARYVGHPLKSITTNEVIKLKKAYASLRDGMVKPDDLFDIETASKVDDLNAAVAQKQQESHS